MSLDKEAKDFFKYLYYDNEYRITRKKDISNDLLLYKKNHSLKDDEDRLVKKYYSEEYPIVFIVGNSRTGSTFLSQLLADYTDIGYINNYVARYWMVPLYGMIEFQRNKEKLNTSESYESFLGVTNADSSPHEFGFFWQYWCKHIDSDELSDDEISEINWNKIREELYSISGLLKKPLLIKSMKFVDFKIKMINEVFRNSFFIHMTRKPFFVCQSLLESRIKQYGSIDIFWSTRPKEINAIKQLTPYEQVVQQYFLIEKGIKKGLEFVPENKQFKVRYEDLIENPNKVILNLANKLNLKYNKKENHVFKNGNTIRLGKADEENLVDSLKRAEI